MPRYLSDVWEKHAGHDVGTLIIKPANGKTDIIFKSTPGLCGPSGWFLITSILKQFSLGLFYFLTRNLSCSF